MRKVVPLLLSLFLLAGCATPVAQEYQEGHLPGSKNIPMQQLDKGSAVAENKNIPCSYIATPESAAVRRLVCCSAWDIPM